MRMFIRNLKSLSYIVLFFFLWTFGPLFQIPTAIAAGKNKPSVVSHQQHKATAQGQKANAGSSERFEKALEDIRENVRKADEREGKGESVASELAAVKTKRAEIESLDADLRKQFSATEKKLKDANLPKEILDRHYAFVKHYKENFKELKANLDDVEKTKSNHRSFKAALDKAMLQLDKTKAPSKHIPLDPNNLPNRLVRGKRRAPRLKREDFEKEFGPQKIKGTRTADYRLPTGYLDANSRGWMGIADSALRRFSSSLAPHAPPSLLAYNGPAGDMPLNFGIEPGTDNREPATQLPDLAFSLNTDLSILNLATVSAVAQPTPDDLAETPEVQFTQDIKDLAAQLDHNPAKIYNWVRNNIEYAPTYGSIQGAEMCLQTQQCNDMDTASLLIALLRVSNIPAHYVYGTIEVPIDKIENWVGGFTDPVSATSFIASGGIPGKLIYSGGVPTKIQMEHVWVEPYVPYGPYSGRPSNLNPDRIWVPLDPSFKQYTYTDGLDLQSAVPFDAQTFANQVQSSATINQTDGSVTNVDSNYILTTMTNYQTQVQNYISQNMPNATVGDIIGKKEINKQEFGILPVTLPYEVITVGAKYSDAPDNLRQKVTLEIQDGSATSPSLSYTVSIPEVAGKRLTLSYAPDTAADQQVIDNYGGIFSTPAYLVNMTPQVKIEGVTVATGHSIGLGDQETFNMTFQSPSGTADSVVSNSVTVGAYYGIGIDPNKVTQAVLDKRRAKLAAVQSMVNDAAIYTDDYIGELIYSTAMAYFFELDEFTNAIAHKDRIADLRHVSEAIVSKDVNVASLYGVPTAVTDASMTIDVDRLVHSAVSQNGDQSKEYNFTVTAGQMSSALEHGIFEQMYQAQGVSTIQVLQLANSQGIPIHTITPQNISFVLPQLQVSSDVITDIQNAVNAGKNVVIPQQDITYYGWTGTGYIVMDPSTGSGAYMISTSLAAGGHCLAAGGTSPDNYCSIHSVTEFAHLADVALEFLAFAMTPIGLSFYLSVTVASTVGLVFAASLLIVGVIFACILINAYSQILKNYAYNYGDRERRQYATGRLIKLS